MMLFICWSNEWSPSFIVFSDSNLTSFFSSIRLSLISGTFSISRLVIS
jgi:hypothetical protein